MRCNSMLLVILVLSILIVFQSAEAQVSFVGSYDTPGEAFAVAVVDDYAYVADGKSGLQILDISDPTSPALVHSYSTSGTAYDVAVAGDYAYVADGYSGLLIIDVSHPSSPTFVGSIDTPDFASGVAVEGDYAFVAAGVSGLHIIDIVNPFSPYRVGTCLVSSYANGVFVTGNYAYVANHSRGLAIIDIFDPASPFLVGECETYGHSWNVVVEKYYAYVADFGCGFQVIGVSDPNSPTGAFIHCDPAGNAMDVTFSEEFVYVAYRKRKVGLLQIFNVSNPFSPYVIYSYDTPDWTEGVVVVKNSIYLANSESGLIVLEFKCKANEKGNVDNDCELTVSDVIRTVNIMLKSGPEPTPHELWAADCNGPVNNCDGDGVVNALDVIKIVRLILEVEECP